MFLVFTLQRVLTPLTCFVESVETPVIRVLAEVESLMRPRVTDKGLSLNVILASPVPDRILSDPTRLRQILLNLAGNAAKFTQQGKVTLTARVEQQNAAGWYSIWKTPGRA